MGLFACDRCGCVDNTALSTGYLPMVMLSLSKNAPRDADIIANVRATLGLAPDAPLGVYCSVCTPIWYDRGSYGKGVNPNPTPGQGLWHNHFPRHFLPHGLFETGRTGEIQSKGGIEKPEAYYRDTEWPPTMAIPGDPDLHLVGNQHCAEGWCGNRYPLAHTGCGGLIHANFGDESYDGYYLNTKCDKCGERVDE